MKKISICLLFLLSLNIGRTQVFNEVSKLVPSDGAANDYFASNVSISGDFIIAGMSSDDNINGASAGSAFIYHYNGFDWVEFQKIIPADGATNNDFGRAVSISGNRAMISSRYFVNGSIYRSVYVFEFDGSSWNETAKLYPSDTSYQEWFGYSIDLEGDRAIIGDISNDSVGINSGSAYVFEYDGNSWNEVQEIFASDMAAGDNFGVSVSLSGDRVLIGATGNDNINGNFAGAAYIYEYDGVTWVQQQKLIASNGDDSDIFGNSVSIDSNTIVVGAYWQDQIAEDAGAAYVFEFDGSSFQETAILTASNGEIDDLFGEDVFIHDDKIIVCAMSNPNQNGVDAGTAYVFEKINSNWIEVVQLIPSDGNSSVAFGNSISVDENNIVIGHQWNSINGPTSGAAYVFKLAGVTGKIYNDLNQNCTDNNLENGLHLRRAFIEPGNIIVETNTFGYWSLNSLPVGNYTVTFDTSGKWAPTCSSSLTFSITNTNIFNYTPAFGLISTEPCADPEISIFMPAMRPCFTDQNIYVNAGNGILATSLLLDSYVDLELDPLLTPGISSLTYTNLGNDIYRFNLPDTLFPGECINFWVETALDCSATLGSTLCIKANMYPADSCVFDTIPADIPADFTPCSTDWDKSSITVDGWCDNDTIFFTIKNIGDDMQCFSPVRLFIDGNYVSLDSILLSAFNVDTIVIPGDGRTYRLEADQHPLHPGNSHPNATVELCGGNANWTPNLVNILPEDDADPIVDIYCGLVTSSYDPNDKTGFPLGVTDTNYIKPNQKIDYVIRFQNTGTDTAFTVIIRDTLELDFDIFSIRSGVASHPYTFSMFGPRILEWKFSNILLPDSTTDEQGSHGFITFAVNQNPNLVHGTELTNTAGIYFDYNSPIITNTSLHTIQSMHLAGLEEIYNSNLKNLNYKIYPNPTNGNFVIEQMNIIDSPFEITDITGKIIYTGNLKDKLTNVDLSNKENGIYLLKFENQTFKLIKQ